MSTTTSGRWAAMVAVMLMTSAPAQAWNPAFGHLDVQAGDKVSEAPIILAQAGDSSQRINQLEEDNRRLNGRVEELSFQLLQLQEQLRKLQEDNEFRFQELEGGAAGASGAAQRTEGAAPATVNGGNGSGDPEFSAVPPLDAPGSAQSGAAGTGNGANGDAIGDLLGGAGLDTSGLGGTTPPAGGVGTSDTVAVITPNGPSEVYDLGYNYLLAGDYQLAENSFRQYAQTYPDAADAPDARYWLGESLFAQGKYTDAAEVFLNAQKDHPKSGRAPEMLLKLGMSLAKLDNRDTACVTFKEVSRRYPNVSANVQRKLEAETRATGC